MADRPIIFSGQMVRAILDGKKTQTRRVVKPQPPHSCYYEINGAHSHALCFANEHAINGGLICVPPTSKSTDHRLPCPYGAPGDTLWVRETWGPCDGGICYQADEAPGVRPDDGRWHSPIHMHRSFSRLSVRVTGMRVERLQAITEDDASAEGVCRGFIEPDEYGPLRYGFVLGDEDGKCPLYPTERSAFERAWDSINGKRAPWSSNPLVWVVSFDRVDGAK